MTQPNIRMLASNTAKTVTCGDLTNAASQRVYAAAAEGTAIDVQLDASRMLEANGWTHFGGQATAGSGPSTSRPAIGDLAAGPFAVGVGGTYYDSTPSKVITWTGTSWRDGRGNAV